MLLATSEANFVFVERTRMTSRFFALRRSAVLSISLVMALGLAACSTDDGGGNGGDGGDASAAASADAGGGSGSATVENGAVEITAANLEFDVNEIVAPAGEAFTVTLVNDDSAPHNFSVYREEGGEEIVVGDVFEGGATGETEVPALEAGTYFFVCDIHPEMNGTIVVEG
jgi:plastocyanin